MLKKLLKYSVIILIASFFQSVHYCSKEQPTQPNISSRKGTLIIKVVSEDSTLNKEASSTALARMTATIYNSQNVQIGTAQTVQRSGSSDSAHFEFKLDPANNLKVIVIAYDNANNEKYRGEKTFNIYENQTTKVSIIFQFQISQEQTTVSSDKDSIPADGSSVCTVKIIPKFANGNPIGDGLDVSFNSTLGTLVDSDSFNTIDKSYSQQLKSSTTHGTASISVRVKGIVITKNITVKFFRVVSPTLTIVAADSLSIPANGVSMTTIRVIPKDYSGSNLGSGQTVTLSATLGTLIGFVWYTPSDQIYSQRLLSSTTPGTAEVTATVNGVVITNKVNISFGPVVSPTLTAITASSMSIPADGNSTTTVKVIPKDYAGTLLGSGQTVSFSSTLGTMIDSVTYNSSDQSYSQQLKSSTTSGTAEVTATVNGVVITNKVSITFEIVISPTLTTVTADSLSIPADGVSKTAIRVIPKDYSGSNLGSGQTVTLSTTFGTLIGSVWYTPSDQIYSQRLQSSTTPGTAEVTATVNGVVITNKVNITFTPSGDFTLPEMVLVPAGEFQMGDNFNEGNSDEKPVHRVYLSAYYIGKYEVTNAEYKKFKDDGGYTTQSYWTAGGFGQYGSQPAYWNNSQFRGGGISGNENFPVVGVSWFEAMAYCKWLSVKTGKTYRLPTEAEWEKAARGTNQRRYPWGNTIDGSYANYMDSGDPYDNGLTPVGYYDGNTHGSFTTHNNASPYGAYDMAGNAAEWCYDWYDNNYYASSPTYNPLGPTGGSFRVIRSGGWKYSTSLQRSAYRRDYSIPGYKDLDYVGFRCLKEQ